MSAINIFRLSTGALDAQLRGAFVVLLTLPAYAAAAERDAFEATVALVSDYVIRGYTQTQGAAALQAGISYSGRAGWMAGLWSSSVDFVAAGAPPDGARIECDAYVGRSWSVGERASMDASLVRYLYPGALPGTGYDYSELGVALRYGEAITATIYYSNDVFGSGHEGVLYEFAAQHAVGAGVTISGRLGDYRLARVFGPDYRYYSIGLERSFGKLTLSGRYHDTDRAAERIWGAAAGARFVLELRASL